MYKSYLILLKPAEYRLYTSTRLTQPVITPVSVNDVEDAFQYLEVFPNPATDKLFIRNPNGWQKEIRVDLYDISGKCVRSSSDFTKTQDGYKMETQNLQAGIYFLQIKSEGKVDTRKIFIQD